MINKRYIVLIILSLSTFCYCKTSDTSIAYSSDLMDKSLKIVVANLKSGKFASGTSYKSDSSIKNVYFQFYKSTIESSDINSNCKGAEGLLTQNCFSLKYSFLSNKDTIDSVFKNYSAIGIESYYEFEKLKDLKGEVFLGITKPYLFGDNFIVKIEITSKGGEYTNYQSFCYILFDKKNNFLRASIHQGLL